MTGQCAQWLLCESIISLFPMDSSVVLVVQENVVRSIIRAPFNALPSCIPALADNCASSVRDLSTIRRNSLDYSGRTRVRRKCPMKVPPSSPQKKHFGPDFSRIRAEMSVARCAPPPRASKRLRRASPCRGIPRSRPHRAEPHRRSRRSRRARPSRGRPRTPRGP